VRWGVAGNILVSWVLTLPAAAAVDALMELVTRFPGGDAIVFGLAAAITGTDSPPVGGRYDGSVRRYKSLAGSTA
jgi:hypothetical protein